MKPGTEVSHKARVLNIKGRSYRLKDLEQTLGTVRS